MRKPVLSLNSTTKLANLLTLKPSLMLTVLTSATGLTDMLVLFVTWNVTLNLVIYIV